MVGCCGFPTSKEKYYRVFKLVEINSTFYAYPRKTLLEKWRREAPEGFEFAVKAHQDISHRFKLEVNEECIEAFERMKEICYALEAKVLLIQTPESFKPSPEGIKRIKNFFETIEKNDLTIVWETRGLEWERLDIRRKIAEDLSQLDILHVTDPLRIMPAYSKDLVYFRLHGLGARRYYYQHSNNDLVMLAKIVNDLENIKKTYILFNNLAMWDDARRFQDYLKDRKLPHITQALGLGSIHETLAKTHYPIDKMYLSKNFGWRLIEWKEETQIPLDTFLKKIPSRSYKNVEEIIEEIKRIGLT